MSTIFRQLFDPDTSTLSYIIADTRTRAAAIIDPVREHTAKYLAYLREVNLQLMLVLDTHIHADHITGAAALREATGARTVGAAHGGPGCVDIAVEEGRILRFGEERVGTLETPGHTPGSLSFRWRDRLFTGDALLIGGCGRTDFQGGDAGALYDSVTEKLFTLPFETLIYPGHDYHGMRVSCVGQEKLTNPRFLNKTREQFITMMGELSLPPPARIDVAVPANLACGKTAAEQHGI